MKSKLWAIVGLKECIHDDGSWHDMTRILHSQKLNTFKFYGLCFSAAIAATTHAMDDSNVTRTSVTLTEDVLRQFLMITPKQNVTKFRTGYTREC